jgi:TRAP-type mannitol/chloroaromatic compound transport system substrate-binding protein
MDRRSFLGTTALAGLAACSGRSEGPAVHTGQRVRWRLVSSFPRSLDTIFGACEVLVDRVAEMTDGQFEIRVFPAGELVPGLQVLDAVQSGVAHIGQSGSYYYMGKNPALAFDTCVPFGLTARQQTAWLDEAGGRELLAPLFADFGVHSLGSGNTGVQMGGWFTRTVPTLADLEGLRMRIPGMGGKVMQRLGVAPQTIAGGEIYTALERGAIDATDWVGPYDDEKLGFHKVAKHYYYPGGGEPGPSLSFYVGTEAMASLPSSYRAILKAAAAEAATAMQSRYDAKNPPALQRLLASGIETHRFGDDILTAAQTAARDTLSDLAAADPSFAKVYEQWEAYRKASFQWFGAAELAYHGFAFR